MQCKFCPNAIHSTPEGRLLFIALVVLLITFWKWQLKVSRKNNRFSWNCLLIGLKQLLKRSVNQWILCRQQHGQVSIKGSACNPVYSHCFQVNRLPRPCSRRYFDKQNHNKIPFASTSFTRNYQIKFRAVRCRGTCCTATSPKQPPKKPVPSQRIVISFATCVQNRYSMEWWSHHLKPVWSPLGIAEWPNVDRAAMKVMFTNLGGRRRHFCFCYSGGGNAIHCARACWASLIDFCVITTIFITYPRYGTSGEEKHKTERSREFPQ